MFGDRKESGSRLAEKLAAYREGSSVIVLALPRGGVVTGYEVARSLRVPLDVIIVRKIGFPGQPELAVGAVSETGTVVLNERLIAAGGVRPEYLDEEIERRKVEIERRVQLYRGGRILSGLEGKTVILVDDGVATGATIKSAIETLHKERLERLVVAVPVAPPSTAAELEAMTDEFICLAAPADFMAVGNFYRDFRQTTDEEVVEMLRRSPPGNTIAA